jgi:hypothetical protein
MAENPIRGRVAKLITDEELVINRGRRDGVRQRMRFDVLDTRTQDVKDPDTGEVLGSIRRAKTRVIVTAVEDQLCLAERVRSGISALVGLSRAFEPRTTVGASTRSAELAHGSGPSWVEGVLEGDPVEEVLNVEPSGVPVVAEE